MRSLNLDQLRALETVIELASFTAAARRLNLSQSTNGERGDDHGVNLSAMPAVAKRLKAQHDLANEFWATGDTLQDCWPP